MKLVQRKGNILDAACHAIVNPVNCVGVAGKGLALQIKNKYPNWFRFYREACLSKEYAPGILHVYETREPDIKYIIDFPTKKHWKNPSELDWIYQGLLEFNTVLALYPEIKSIAMPPIGCGNGGLSWNLVKPLILHNLDQFDIELHLWEPR